MIKEGEIKKQQFNFSIYQMKFHKDYGAGFAELNCLIDISNLPQSSKRYGKEIISFLKEEIKRLRIESKQ